MPLKVFDSTSVNTANEVDTYLFVQIRFLRTKFIESIIEEDNDMKNHLRNQNLKDHKSIRGATSKKYVDTSYNDRSIKKTHHMLTSMIRISITLDLLR